MNDHALAALFVLVAWWASTALVLKVVWLPATATRLSVGASTVLALGGLAGLSWTSATTSSVSAYVSFVCALAIWGWHELTFLLGLITGPRTAPCPPDARGLRRFGYGTSVVIHHEVALALTLVAVAALTWGKPNQVGAWTFLVLWVMRLSAKLNVFLGVRNLTEQFVPDHLRYMLSYFRRARMNVLMPFSVAGGSAMVAWLLQAAFASDATSFVVVSRTLVATILALAVVEHVFLAAPVPDAMLWRWAIRNKRAAL